MKLKISYLLAASVALTGANYLANPPGLSAAPVVTLKATDGRLFDLAASGETTRLVTFFSPDCPLSKRDWPTLSELNNKHSEDTLEIVSVTMPYDQPAATAPLIESGTINYPVVTDTDGSIGNAFPNVRFTPTTFLIDKKGEIVWRHTGRINPQELHAELALIE
ncbi:hypothetical protein AB833_04770 [Chromatiales bacterium (ex Bugula neritina AB1)]|nr:hypothetical protein AB833_04770 [Chromatiales bacterium (ex Bugula neritina AB1)]